MNWVGKLSWHCANWVDKLRAWSFLTKSFLILFEGRNWSHEAVESSSYCRILRHYTHGRTLEHSVRVSFWRMNVSFNFLILSNHICYFEMIWKLLIFQLASFFSCNSESWNTFNPHSTAPPIQTITFLPHIFSYVLLKISSYSFLLNSLFRYVENGSLCSVLKKFGFFSESLAAIYVTQILKGLKYLHDMGVIHRDIKGANLLTTKDGKKH